MGFKKKEPVVDVCLVHLQNFVVADDARVHEVQSASHPELGGADRDRQHLFEHRHGIGHVNYFGIVDDLCNKVSSCELGRDRHANAQRQTVVIMLQQILHKGFCVGVKRTVEVGHVGFGKAWCTNRVRVVVFENTPRREIRNVNATLFTTVHNRKCANDVCANGFGLVFLAPINRWATGEPSSHQHVRRLVCVQIVVYVCDVFNTCISNCKLELELFAQLHKMFSNPSRFGTIDQKLRLCAFGFLFNGLHSFFFWLSFFGVCAMNNILFKKKIFFIRSFKKK